VSTETGAIDDEGERQFRVRLDRLAEVRDEQPVGEMNGRGAFASSAGGSGRGVTLWPVCAYTTAAASRSAAASPRVTSIGRAFPDRMAGPETFRKPTG
jgi:hypothetical protein